MNTTLDLRSKIGKDIFPTESSRIEPLTVRRRRGADSLSLTGGEGAGEGATCVPGEWLFRHVRVAFFLFTVIASVSLVHAGQLQLLSARNPSVPLPAGGNDNSVAPCISGDGRFVVYSSSANDLTPGGNSPRALNVYLRDRTWNSTALVSVSSNGPSGGNGDSLLGRISSGGRYVVFQSDASNLVPGDTNGASDVFVRDMITGTTRLVSVATDGASANGASSDPVMTPDGTCVVFISTATNLVAGDANGIPDVFVRNLITQTTYLVSVGAVPPGGSTSAGMATPVMTPDGRFVAFRSTARGLVPGLPASPRGEVFLRDLQAGRTIWTSTNATALLTAAYGTTAPDNASYHPGITDDGRYVVFKTGSTNPGTGLPGSFNTVWILRYDAATATTTVITTNGWGIMSDENDAFGPEITPDGSRVAYVNREDTNQPSTYPPYSSVRVWDSETGQDTLASGTAGGVPASTWSRSPLISPSGRFVAFVSTATNLVGNAVSNGFHIYRRDLAFNTTQLVDVDTNGMGTSDEALACLSISAGGRCVAFSSPDGNLSNLDRNHAWDVFVREINQGTNDLISRRDPTVVPATGDAFSSLSPLSVSADGRWTAFASWADDLIPNDTNQFQDVFVRDLKTGSIQLASVAPDGSQAAGGWSAQPIISGNGRYVAFISTATNLVPGQTNPGANFFRRDLLTGVTTLVSVSTNGVSPGSGDCYYPSISRDGRYVVFASTALNLAPGLRGNANAFWRDVDGGTTQVLTNFLNGVSAMVAPSLSPDGRYVAYFYRDIQVASASLRVRDRQLAADIYVNPGLPTSLAIDPTGTKLLYAATNNLYLLDILAGTNFWVAKSSLPLRNAAEWSGDGRFVAFVSTTNLAGGDDVTNKLYLCDLLSNTITPVNLNLGQAGSLSAWFDAPAMSGDGRFVAYRMPTNNVAGVTNPSATILLFDRFIGSSTVLPPAQPAAEPGLWVSRPALSGSGATIAFLSMNSGLVTRDLNRVQDAFAAGADIGAPLDSDADGIPDWWMIQYFGHATGQGSDLSRAEDDADGDGMSNLQEWLAGTDPTDASSRLLLVIADMSDAGVTLTWQSVSGTRYSVQRGDLGSQPFSTIQSNIIGQVGTTSCTDTNGAGPGPLFYRVMVQ